MSYIIGSVLLHVNDYLVDTTLCDLSSSRDSTPFFAWLAHAFQRLYLLSFEAAVTVLPFS